LPGRGPELQSLSRRPACGRYLISPEALRSTVKH
jgi:hypothetical protein